MVDIMSINKFKEALKNCDSKKLYKYSKKLPISTFMKYVVKSFNDNRKLYDLLIPVLFMRFDLNDVVKYVIEIDNVELLENILSHEVCVDLDEELIELTVPKGRVTMAKAIYEFIYCQSESDDSDVFVSRDDHNTVVWLMKNYKFNYDSVKNENSIDSCILSLRDHIHKDAKKIMSSIRCDFWDNFLIIYVCIYKYAYFKIINRVLLDDTVDPCIGDNSLLEYAINKKHYLLANELLKHPSIPVQYVDVGFVMYLIKYNRSYVAEKIMRSDCRDVFKKPDIISQIFSIPTDIIFLAIRFNVVDIHDLHPDIQEVCTRYLTYKFDDYIPKAYRYNLDPLQIYINGLKYNDLDLLKSIKSYMLSIKCDMLLGYLAAYSRKYEDIDSDDNAYNYVLDHVFEQYDPITLLREADKIGLIYVVYNAIKNNNLSDYDARQIRLIYEESEKFTFKNMCHKKNMMLSRKDTEFMY